MSNSSVASFDLVQFWVDGDFVSHFVAITLIFMSILSWFFILSKLWGAWRIRKCSVALHAFWKAPTFKDAIDILRATDSENIYVPLAQQGAEVANFSPSGMGNSLNAAIDPNELITRALRQEISRASSRLDSGLTLLASVGSTAPFVGLLGTVWGIYHALSAISGMGSLQIDKVAGPVGESLIMTALGLVVAIPAVLAFNAFNRINRITLSELDGFAHDLHSYLTAGVRVGKE